MLLDFQRRVQIFDGVVNVLLRLVDVGSVVAFQFLVDCMKLLDGVM